ncbi:MAG: hypothetical protein PHS06_02005 [Candidatus Shapirobacteria bacterium]|nr:hypothetical protein [Candidatus Shapirobacteria bacterium]
MAFIAKLKPHWDKIFLSLVLFFLFYKNFTPNTWLIGWDNLVPELNIWLNLKRSFLAVWQEYQGLGLVGGMGHATEIIRQIILLPFILILPHNLIRYLWQFLMLTLGVFSLNFGLKKIFHLSKISSLLGSFFYLLNFGTIQFFWVPFEPFSTFWGFFPALFFVLFNYLKNPNRKNLIYFTLINFLAIPSFYVQTIFIVYIICLFLILLSHFIINFRKLSFKLYSTAILIIFLLNSFWFLPSIYFLKNDSHNTTQAYGNIMSNQETFDRNQNHGTISDFLLLKNYYYDFPKGENSTLMSPWASHFSNQYYLIYGYFVSIFIIIGLISLFTKSNQKPSLKLSLLLIFFLCSIALLSSTPIFSEINYCIRQIPIINQIFRSPWTKFLVPTVFVFSVLLSIGLENSFKFLTKIKYSPKFSKIIISFIFLFCLFSFSFPIFQGQFFYSKMKNELPSKYSELFLFFKEIPSTARIMNLPQGSFWGWTNYRWGSVGSGFLWYGLNQPILDRAFDVWNLKNETYYWELTSAIQQKNPLAIKSIFDKYSIEYVIFDDDVFFPDEKIYGKLVSPSLDLLSQIDGLILIKTIGSIYIFQYQLPTQIYSTNSINNTPSIAHFNPNFQPQNIPPSNTAIYPNEHSSVQNPQLNQNTENNQIYFHFQNKQSHNYLTFNFSNLTFDQDYLLKIESRNLSGQTPIIASFDNYLHFYFSKNQLKTSSDWQTTWILIPKMEKSPFNTGLIVMIDNPSFNQKFSINDVKSPQIYPYQNNIPVIENYQSPQNKYFESKSNIFYYYLKLNQDQDNYLVLPQSFHKGWIAFYFNGFKPVFLKNHTLINDWANGWEIPKNYDPSPTIYFLFWPQILEFIGFILLIPTFIFVFKKSKKLF